MGEVREELKEKLRGEKAGEEKYRQIKESILEVTKKYGVKRKEARTGDKLTNETLELIDKKNTLRKNSKGKKRNKIEENELGKLIKRKVREDINNYEEEIIRDILQQRGSNKEIRKTLRKGKSMITKVKDSRGNIIQDRKGILQTVASFNKKLCGEEETKKRVWFEPSEISFLRISRSICIFGKKVLSKSCSLLNFLPISTIIF